MRHFEYRKKLSTISSNNDTRTSYEGSIEIKRKKWFGFETWEPIYFFEDNYVNNVTEKLTEIMKALSNK